MSWFSSSKKQAPKTPTPWKDYCPWSEGYSNTKSKTEDAAPGLFDVYNRKEKAKSTGGLGRSVEQSSSQKSRNIDTSREREPSKNSSRFAKDLHPSKWTPETLDLHYKKLRKQFEYIVGYITLNVSKNSEINLKYANAFRRTFATFASTADYLIDNNKVLAEISEVDRIDVISYQAAAYLKKASKQEQSLITRAFSEIDFDRLFDDALFAQARIILDKGNAMLKSEKGHFEDFVESLNASLSPKGEMTVSEWEKFFEENDVVILAEYLKKHMIAVRVYNGIRLALLTGTLDCFEKLRPLPDEQLFSLCGILCSPECNLIIAQYNDPALHSQDVADLIASFTTTVKARAFFHTASAKKDKSDISFRDYLAQFSLETLIAEDPHYETVLGGKLSTFIANLHARGIAPAVYDTYPQFINRDCIKFVLADLPFEAQQRFLSMLPTKELYYFLYAGFILETPTSDDLYNDIKRLNDRIRLQIANRPDNSPELAVKTAQDTRNFVIAIIAAELNGIANMPAEQRGHIRGLYSLIEKKASAYFEVFLRNRTVPPGMLKHGTNHPHRLLCSALTSLSAKDQENLLPYLSSDQLALISSSEFAQKAQPNWSFEADESLQTTADYAATLIESKRLYEADASRNDRLPKRQSVYIGNSESLGEVDDAWEDILKTSSQPPQMISPIGIAKQIAESRQLSVSPSGDRKNKEKEK